MENFQCVCSFSLQVNKISGDLLQNNIDILNTTELYVLNG